MKITRSLRMSVAAVAILAGGVSHMVLSSTARADDRMAGSGPAVYSASGRLSAQPGDVSDDPLANVSSDSIRETVLLDVPSMDDLADIAPASGGPAESQPQILGGSDQDNAALTPDPVAQMPVTPPEGFRPPPPEPRSQPPVTVSEPPPAFLPKHVEASAPVESPAPTPTPVVEVPASTPTPDEILAAPSAAAPGSQMPQAVTGDITSNTIHAPAAEGPDVYYDSRSAALPPSGPLANTSPRKVDPIKEPASKLVVTNRTHRATDQEALVVAASRALDLGRNESALEMYDQLYAKNKRDARILMGRAIAQQRMGLDDLALLSYEELLKLAPDNTEAVVNMMGLMQKQYPEIALRRLSDLRDRYPANDMIIAQLGMVHATMGNMNEAIRFLTTAATLAPNNALHLYNLAVLSDRGGQKDRAVKYYQDALKTDAVYGGGKSVPRAQIYDRLSQLR